MANESEGVLDVLREWRDMVCYSKGPVHPLCHGAIMNNLDRIEAAWKREREALEAHVRSLQSQLKVAYSCGEQPQGNAAAIYAALVKIHDLVNTLDEKCGVDPVEIRDIARAALAAPARQCDVGTPDEQGERCLAQFNEWRRKSDGKKLITAIMAWAQTPYAAEEGAGE